MEEVAYLRDRGRGGVGRLLYREEERRHIMEYVERRSTPRTILHLEEGLVEGRGGLLLIPLRIFIAGSYIGQNARQGAN